MSAEQGATRRTDYAKVERSEFYVASSTSTNWVTLTGPMGEQFIVPPGNLDEVIELLSRFYA